MDSAQARYEQDDFLAEPLEGVEECIECSGEGVVEALDGPRSVWIACPDCGGEGFVYDDEPHT